MLPTLRPGHRARTEFWIPEESDLDRAPESVDRCRILKVERKTVIWRCLRPEDGAPVVYKMYRNRGCVSWQREKLFQFRAEREFLALDFLRREGIPCSEPLFWSFGWHPAHGRHEILCMREIPGAESLREVVDRGRQHEIDFTELYALLRKMHRAGFYHGRMEPRDIMIGAAAAGERRLHVIDTPQSMVFGADIASTAMARVDVREISLWANKLLGADACRALLMRYGMDEAAAAATLREINQPATPRLVRHFRRFVFGLRSRYSRLARAESRAHAEA